MSLEGIGKIGKKDNPPSTNGITNNSSYKQEIDIYKEEAKVLNGKELESFEKTDTLQEKKDINDKNSKLSPKDRWQNFKGKIYRLFHGTEGMQRNPNAPKPWE